MGFMVKFLCQKNKKLCSNDFFSRQNFLPSQTYNAHPSSPSRISHISLSAYIRTHISLVSFYFTSYFFGTLPSALMFEPDTETT